MEATPSTPVIPAAEKSAGLTKRKKLMIALGVVAAVIAVYFIYEHIFYVKTDNAQVRAHSVMLSAKVNGFIKTVAVEENQKVKAGDVLAEIDNKDFRSRTNQAESETASLEARMRDAQRNFVRVEELYKAGAVSQQQRDTAQATFSELSRKMQALNSQVDLSKSSLNDTQIRAPFDGVVAKRAAEVGMLASPGMPLFGFVSTKERWIVANFKETDLEDIHLGKEVDVEVDAISDHSFRGTVESLSPATGATFSLLPMDNATGNFTKVVQRVPVRIKLENLTPEEIDLLKAGLSAEVKVHIR